MAAFGTALAFASNEMKKFQAETEFLTERGLDRIAKQTENLKLDQSFRSQLKVLESLDPELESIRQKYLQIETANKGADADTVLRIRRAAALEEKKLLDSRLEAIAKEQQAVINRVSGQELANAALGKTGDALRQAEIAQLQFNLSIDESLQKFTQQAAALEQLGRAAINYKAASATVATGQAARTDFQNQFGVVFDFERQISGQQLADKFAATFETLKNNPRAATQLQEAFGALVTQAVQIGVPDLPELLSNKLGSANFARLRAGLGDDLRAALDDSAIAGQQWGDVFDTEFKKYVANTAEVGARTEELRRKMADLEASVVRDFAMNLDVSQPIQAAQQVQAQLNAIPDVTYKTVIVQTLATGSPTMSFSDYFGNYLPRKIDEITKLSPELTLGVKDYTQRARNITFLREQIQQIEAEATLARERNPSSISNLSSQRSAFLRDQAGNLTSRLSDMVLALESDLSTSRAGLGNPVGSLGSGGGTAGVVVNLDLRGSTMSREFLDDEMIPALERGIIRATGQDANFRVLN
jgi:hypothetical protein